MIEFKKKPDREKEIWRVLHPWVKEWFKEKFKNFCLPQLFSILEIHSRNNMLISAPTGSGKTLTAFLSILNELVDSADKGILEDRVYATYISPLKALNSDISVNLIEPLKEIEEIAGKELGIRVAVRTGDTTAYEKQKMLKKCPHILITTPESLAIVLSSYKFIENLKQVQWCIIDEIHALAENKRGTHLSVSVERLGRLSGHMSRIGLSATVAPIEEIAKYLVGYTDGKENNCKIVDVQFLKQLDFKVLSPLNNLIDTTPQKIHESMYKLIDELIQKHKTTLIFTNTRAATERVVDHLKDKFPKKYLGIEDEGDLSFKGIAAHHGSLSKEHRINVEESLRQGKLKCVVCSTSLELGIDIGYIDLVILLSSPKSVARALQRIGRSGHKLHEKAKGRLIVLDRDDLIECSVLLKSAIEKKIDKIHIPILALDVLAQQMIGIALEGKIHIEDMWKLIKQSYCYKDLTRGDFNHLIEYLTGKYVSLEDRHVYAKIWHDEETGMIGKKGKMTRVIYMTNIGTIPDESFVLAKIGGQTIGKLDEGFVEKLKPGDVFVLGGQTYTFRFSRGQVVQVTASSQRPPTVPRWFSEMLPLSFDLGIEIGKFRRLMSGKFSTGKNKKEILEFINKYLYVEGKAALAIYQYFYEQYNYSEIPSDRRIIVEHTQDVRGKIIVFHTLFGRRVNDCLSRAVAFAVSKTQHKDVEIGISDNGFYVRSDKKFDLMKGFKRIKSEELRQVMEFAIDKTEVMKRRFRHCATRALMILRNYKGIRKRVGRQQVSSMILMAALKRIDKDFSILKEARREVLEDLMDIENTIKILKDIEEKKIKVEETFTDIPTPFAFNLVVQGYTDILKMEDKIEFLKRMHQNVLAKISLSKGKKGEVMEEIDVEEWLEETDNKRLEEKDEEMEELKSMIWNLPKVPAYAKDALIKLIEGENIRQDVIDSLYKYKKEIEKTWPKKLIKKIWENL